MKNGRSIFFKIAIAIIALIITYGIGYTRGRYALTNQMYLRPFPWFTFFLCIALFVAFIIVILILIRKNKCK